MIAIVASNDNVRCEAAFKAIAAACEALGHNVKYYIPAEYPRFKGKPDAVFVWNGGKGKRGEIAQRMRDEGIPVFVLERGFFDRQNYIQIDRKGFNHTSHWADYAGIVPHIPECTGFDRLVRIIGRQPRKVKARNEGYILVLCQVDGDEQLGQSEIHHADTLVDVVTDAVIGDVEVKVRAHPLGKRYLKNRTITHGMLKEDIAGARFCVTINSNAGNDAISYGCPVLSFGPSVYQKAGMAKKARVRTIVDNIQIMLNGWGPDGDSNLYLGYLANRQWNEDELRNGNVVKNLLEGRL
jgi:hypothetical protein